MALKPCIQCGKECEILPVELGDIFTLTFLRICSGECIFLEVYDYLYSIGYHKDFRNKLYDKQDDGDKKARDAFIESTTKEFLDRFQKGLERNPKLLTTPAPTGILEMFTQPSDFLCSPTTMTFTRPSTEDKIKWQRDHIDRLKKELEEANEDMAKLEKEIETI
jgi:hypothetical protein